MLKTSEGRERLTALRPSKTVSRQSDAFEDATSASLLQASRLSRRFKISPSLATAIAELAFGAPETWGSRR